MRLDDSSLTEAAVTSFNSLLPAAFTLGGVFLFYVLVCLVSIAFVVLVVPETKNKSLEEISKELKAK